MTFLGQGLCPHLCLTQRILTAWLWDSRNNVLMWKVCFHSQVKKTTEATLQTIQDMVTIEDYDVSECFQHSRSTESVKSTVSETYLSKPSIAKRRANQQETEQFYFMVRQLLPQPLTGLRSGVPRCYLWSSISITSGSLLKYGVLSTFGILIQSVWDRI